MLAVLLFIIALILVYVTYETQKRKYRKSIDKFDGPSTIPIFGNYHSIMMASSTETFRILNQKVEEFPHKEPIRFWQFHVPYLWIRDPEDIRVVSKISYKDSTYLLLADVTGDGMLTASGKKWKENRSILEPLLNTSLLFEYYLPIFTRESNILVEGLDQAAEGRSVNLFPFVAKAVLTSICETTLGDCEDIDILVNSVVTNNSSEVIMKRMCNLFLHPNFIFKMYLLLTGNRGVFESLRSPFLKVLSKRKQLFEKRNDVNRIDCEKGRTILDILINRHNWSDQRIVDEMITLIFAGTETTSITMCFTLLMLAENEEIQERVWQELRDTFGDCDRVSSLDDLSKLTFLEQCIKETLRKFPIIPQTIRCPSEDLRLKDGRVIPAGTKIVVSIYDAHHDSRYYADPHAWNPHRFDADHGKQLPLHSFVPFGFGLRNCVGYKYAMMSMKIVLSSVLRKFKFSTTETNFDLDVGIILQSKNGYNVKLRRRCEVHYQATTN